MSENITIGVIGGTGAQGRGLAIRWAASGLEVIVGSRSADRARAAAQEIAEAAGVDPAAVRSGDNVTCAAEADVVLLAVPWAAHESTLLSVRDQLVDKVVIDCVNPLGFDKQGAHRLEVGGSAAEAAQRLLPSSRVVGAFHNVSAVLLANLGETSIDTDVLVLGENVADTDMVRALADRIPGVRGIYGGRLRNAGQVEALTANLIAINRRHKTHAGVRITGHGLA